jgi:hypothetical protein
MIRTHGSGEFIATQFSRYTIFKNIIIYQIEKSKVITNIILNLSTQLFRKIF